MKTAIVIDLGFGDSGKGRVVNELVSSSEKSLVVRFSGGQQAGHKVVEGKREHVFSSFGAGTLKGADTFWSQYCTFYPNSFLGEYEALKDLKFYELKKREI